MKKLINIQNEDNKSFRQCLVRYLKPVSKIPAKIRNVRREFTKQFNFRWVKLCKDYEKMMFRLVCLVMQIKHIAIFVFLKKYFEKRVDLLL